MKPLTNPVAASTEGKSGRKPCRPEMPLNAS